MISIQVLLESHSCVLYKQADIQKVKHAVGSAVEVMQTMGSSVCSQLSKVTSLMTSHIQPVSSVVLFLNLAQLILIFYDVLILVLKSLLVTYNSLYQSVSSSTFLQVAAFLNSIGQNIIFIALVINTQKELYLLRRSLLDQQISVCMS